MTALRLRRFVPRFSLRTLVIFLLLVTSGMGLWWHWEPWVCESVATYDDGDWPSAFAISSDGSRVLSTTRSSRGAASIRDSATGRELRRLNRRNTTRTVCAEFSPDGGSVVCGEVFCFTSVYDTRTGELARSVGGVGDSGHRGGVRSTVFSPDGLRVATLGEDSELRVWNLQTRECQLRVRDVASSGGVAFSPDGSRLVYVSGSDRMRVIDADDGRCLKEMPTTTAESRAFSPSSVSFSPDGRRVVVGSGLPHVWDVETSRCLAVLILLEIDGGTTGNGRASFSPTGDRIITTGIDRSVQVWDAEDGRLLALLPHPTEAFAARSVSGGTRIVTCAEHCIRIFRRRRPEWWWGVFYLWEFWLTVVFAGLFVWSVVRDRRALNVAADE